MNSEGSLSVENISTNIQIPRLLCVTVWRRRKIFLTKLFSPRSSGWRCHKKNMLIYLLHKELLTCHTFFPGREGLNLTLHNVLFVQYIFPRNGTSSDLSQNLSFGIQLNIYLSQLVQVCRKYIFFHIFVIFKLFKPWIHPFFPKYAPVFAPSSICIGYRVIKDTGHHIEQSTHCAV